MTEQDLGLSFSIPLKPEEIQGVFAGFKGYLDRIPPDFLKKMEGLFVRNADGLGLDRTLLEQTLGKSPEEVTFLLDRVKEIMAENGSNVQLLSTTVFKGYTPLGTYLKMCKT